MADGKEVHAIIFTYACVAVIEVGLHQITGSRSGPIGQYLFDWYSYKDPQNHKTYVAGLVDVVIPTLILGVAAGYFGAKWRFRELVLTTILLAIGVVALVPFYISFIGTAEFFSSTTEALPPRTLYGVPLLKAAALCGTGLAFSRGWILNRKRSGK